MSQHASRRKFLYAVGGAVIVSPAGLALMGAHIATCPFAVLQQLAKHPLTDVGLERFLADWKKAKSR